MSKLKRRYPDPSDVEEPYDSLEGDPNYQRIHPKDSTLFMWLYDEAGGENALEYEIWKDPELQYWAEWMGRMPQLSLGFFATPEEAEQACKSHHEQPGTS
jgi:hypothetical protein